MNTYWTGVAIVALLPAFLYGWVTLPILETAKEEGGGQVSLGRMTVIFCVPIAMVVVWAWIVASVTFDLVAIVQYFDLPPLPPPLLEAREGILVFMVLGPVGLALLASMLLREAAAKIYQKRQQV